MTDAVAHSGEAVEGAGSSIGVPSSRDSTTLSSPGVVEDLGVEQVHLTQVRLVGVPTYARAMLHQGPGMGIAEHTEPGHQGDRLGRHLREPVALVTTDGDNTG